MAHYNQPYSSPRLPAQVQQFPSGSRTPTPQMTSQQSSNSINAAPAKDKPADYVYFDRTTAGFSDEAVPKAKGAQLKLEHFYKIAVDSAIERNQRYMDPHAVCIQRVLIRSPGALSSRGDCSQTTLSLMNASTVNFSS